MSKSPTDPASRERQLAKHREEMRLYRLRHPGGQREAVRRWREANPEKNKQGQRQWRQNNPEKVKEARRAWARANPEKLQAARLRYIQAHPDRARDLHRSWEKKHPDALAVIRARYEAKKRACRHAADGSLTVSLRSLLSARRLPRDIVDDVASTVTLAVLEGSLTEGEIETKLHDFVTAYYRHSGTLRTLSLDSVIPGTDGLRWIDQLAAPEADGVELED